MVLSLGALGAAIAAPAQAVKRPALSISDATVTEANAGSSSVAKFKVRLSRKAGKRAVKARYRTVPGTASAADFQPVSGTLKIRRGKRSTMLSVLVKGDNQDEANQKFSVVLSQPTRARIRDGTGIATIVDNDAPPCDPPNQLQSGVCYQPATAYDVADGTVGAGTRVFVANLLVIARAGNVAWAVVKFGDAGYTVPEYSGLELDLSGVSPAPSVATGDRITVYGTTANELDAEHVINLSSGEGEPSPFVVTDPQLALPSGAAFDNVLIRATTLTLDHTSAGDWITPDPFTIGNDLIGTLPGYPDTSTFPSITGVGNTGGATAGLMPRTNADIVPDVPILESMTLLLTCVDEGDMSVAAAQVTLASVAAANTFVTVTSDDAAVNVVGGGTTVMTGQTSAPVQVDGVSSGSATLTASLGGGPMPSQELQVANPCT